MIPGSMDSNWPCGVCENPAIHRELAEPSQLVRLFEDRKLLIVIVPIIRALEYQVLPAPGFSIGASPCRDHGVLHGSHCDEEYGASI
jgi:hypothetical protein